MKNKIFTDSSCYISIVLIILSFKYGEGNNVRHQFQNVLLRLNNGRKHGVHEGRVEVSIDFGETWGTICSTHWSMREANVVCHQLKLGYASMADQSQKFGSKKQSPWLLIGTLCSGNEKKLSDCFRESKIPSSCNAMNKNVAVMRCVRESPDLSLDLNEIEETAYLDVVPLNSLTCAMEENCLPKDAYHIRQREPKALRFLLRFATKAENVGNADFSPYANYDEWQWHQCHQHYHSMEYFASFDVYNFKYEKVAEGHKASFCLEDSLCYKGITPVYDCGNRTQGISVGCADLYTPELDCQWVDVTDLPKNKDYILRVALNPEYKIGEISFENNGAECLLSYTGEAFTTKITRCSYAPLWFKI